MGHRESMWPKVNIYGSDPHATWKRGVAKGAKQHERRMEYLRTLEGQARLWALIHSSERAV